MRLLVATYDYPRPGAPGTNRWAVMTKYLRRLGHEVTVVTAAAPGISTDEVYGVVRTADLSSNPTVRRLLRRPTGGTAPPSDSPDGGTTGLVTKVVVPDGYLLSWNPTAARAIKRLARERRFDCLITSGPPDSTHLLGLVSGRRLAPWIAEFRDGWLFEPLGGPFPTAPQRALAGWLERSVATRADAVVGVTRPIADDIRSRLGAPAELISNGSDPEMASAAPPKSGAIDAQKFTFLHTGTATGAWGRNPKVLLNAVRRLLAADAGLAGRVEVLFVGKATAEDLRLFSAPDLDGVVRYGGFVDRSEAFALQRAAGALLLLTSNNVSEATGKLFEYLGAGRPIIALAHNNEAARIVEETGTGVCVPPNDVEAIVTQLRRAIDGELEKSYAPRGLERYSYPTPAQQFASLAERVLSKRSGQQLTASSSGQVLGRTGDEEQ